MTAERTPQAAAAPVVAPALPFKRTGNASAAVIRIAGLVTAATMRALLREVRSCHVTRAGFRLLLDFRAALIVLGDDEWAAWSGEWLRGRSDLGLGFLVGAEAEASLERYVMSAVCGGQITLTFTEASLAYRWLALD
jgi:hypothetical protein